MSVFPRFDPHAFLENQNRTGTPANIANPAKPLSPPASDEPSLATLATLAAAHFESKIPSLDYEYEERAAIMEFDGGLSRQEAERRAWKDHKLRTEQTNEHGN